MMTQLRHMAPKVGWGVVGALGTEAIPSFAARFGVPLPSGQVAAYAVKGGSGLLTAWAVRRFVGREQGNAALLGALLSIVFEPAKGYLLPMIGVAAPVGAYINPDVGAYLSPGSLGYLGPGTTVGDDGGESGDYEPYDFPNRLSPDERL